MLEWDPDNSTSRRRPNSRALAFGVICLIACTSAASYYADYRDEKSVYTRNYTDVKKCLHFKIFDPDKGAILSVHYGNGGDIANTLIVTPDQTVHGVPSKLDFTVVDNQFSLLPPELVPADEATRDYVAGCN